MISTVIGLEPPNLAFLFARARILADSLGDLESLDIGLLLSSRFMVTVFVFKTALTFMFGEFVAVAVSEPEVEEVAPISDLISLLISWTDMRSSKPIFFVKDDVLNFLLLAIDSEATFLNTLKESSLTDKRTQPESMTPLKSQSLKETSMASYLSVSIIWLSFDLASGSSLTSSLSSSS